MNQPKKPNRICNKGYVQVYRPDHHRSYFGYVHEHVIVMEKHLGKTVLPDGCVIHHINQDKKDNQIDNLLLLPTQEIHEILHEYINSSQLDMVKKYETCARNFMNNLKSGEELKNSIPGLFLKSFKNIKK